MELGGVTFTVKLKKSGTVLSQQDVRKISLGASGDSTLDWQTFKSYVSKNLSKNDDFSVAYVDSSEDELPIESECEFREALRYARHRAQNGLETILKVNQEPLLVLNSKANGSDKTPSESHINGNNSNPTMQCLSKEKNRRKHTHQLDNSSNFSYSLDHVNLLFSIIGKLKNSNILLTDTPPPWFRRYMKKFKRKIITELSDVFTQEIDRARCCHAKRTKKFHSFDLNKSKMKSSDDGSASEASEEESDQKKIFKNLGKKREKELMKIFDDKLKQLEEETKITIQKFSEEKSSDSKLCNVEKHNDSSNGNQMDVILLNECKEMIINPREIFTKEWEVINTGSLEWSERTELRHVWATSGFDPEKTVVSCPLLQPGEMGTIKVKFIAPDLPGKYSSFWHLYHNGERFGHWLGCAVIVKKMTQTSQEVDSHVTKETVTTRNTSVDNDTHINQESPRVFGSDGKMEEGKYHKYPYDLVPYDTESDNSSEPSILGSCKNNSENENFVVLPLINLP